MSARRRPLELLWKARARGTDTGRRRGWAHSDRGATVRSPEVTALPEADRSIVGDQWGGGLKPSGDDDEATGCGEERELTHSNEGGVGSVLTRTTRQNRATDHGEEL